MRYRVLFLVVAVVLLICAYASADVPKMMNFQGRLTDASGKFVPDGNYSLTFRIYSDSTGGSAKWSEGQLIALSKGLFNVILGSVNPIPDSIFNYANTYLGIQVGTDPEMTPRQRLSSLGYAYRGAKADTSSYSMNSDKLDGFHASDFSSIGTDYGRLGVATNLYEGDSSLTSKYVHAGQANSITSGMITDNEIVNADISNSANIAPSKIAGTAWTSANDGTGSGLDADLLDGQHASAFLSTASDYGRSGVATDLYEGTTRLIDKYLQQGQASSVNSSMIVDSTITNADISASANISPSKISGTAWTSTNDGSGSGLDADILDGQQGSYYTNAANISTGVLSDGRLSANVDLLNGAQSITGVKTFNPGSGSVPFAVDATKNGAVANLNADLLDGQHASAFLSTGGDYGRSGVATDLYEGTTRLTDKYVNVAGPDSVYSGSGIAFLGKASGSSSSAMHGLHGYADNTSTGQAYGGYFETSSSGTGVHYGVYALVSGSSSVFGGLFNVGSAGTGTHYGIYSTAYGNSSNPAYGSYSQAENYSGGDAYAGNFYTFSSGTGRHYGVYASSYGSSDSATYGVYGYGSNSSSGEVYGGDFETSSSGTGIHFGLQAYARGASTDLPYGIEGIYSEADNTSSGLALGGYFATTSSGTGDRYGVIARGTGSSNSNIYGICASAHNGSNGFAYGGWFLGYSSSGTGFGIYAASATGYAGYFNGNTLATGTKSAAVKVDNGEYRLLYSQESPENWFEDFGEGQLQNGRVHIELDHLFLQTVSIDNQHPLKVFITLTSGEPTNYVVNKGNTGFEVIVSDKTSNATFDYRVVAKRKGYENTRLAKMTGATPEEMALEQTKHQAEMEKERTSMEQERLIQQKSREAEKQNIEKDKTPTQEAR